MENIEKNKLLLPCPNCEGDSLKHCYVYIKCERCLMEGPKTNGGRNDDHVDNADYDMAIINWNKLPRRKGNE
jgi:hypothetical protein